MNNPVTLSALSLQLWCCILSFVFFFVLWLLPFILFGFLLFFLVHSSKKMQNDPSFQWSDFASTMFFYILIIFEAYLFLNIWDHFGIPVNYIFEIYNNSSILNNNNNNNNRQMLCLVGDLQVFFTCCNMNNNATSRVMQSVLSLAQLMVIVNKLLFSVGTMIVVFNFAFYKYKQSKTAYAQQGGNVAFLFVQTTVASILLVAFFAIVFYLFKKLLFFDIATIMLSIFQCVTQQQPNTP